MAAEFLHLCHSNHRAQEPDHTKSQLAYAMIIDKAKSRPSWVVYDQNFRQEATDSGNKEWEKVNPSIYIYIHNVSPV